MSNGSSEQFIWQYAGNPTGAALSILNPPKGAMVINSVNGDWYRKTSGYGDNSGFALVASSVNTGISATVVTGFGVATNGSLTFVNGIATAGTNAANS